VKNVGTFERLYVERCGQDVAAHGPCSVLRVPRPVKQKEKHLSAGSNLRLERKNSEMGGDEAALRGDGRVPRGLKGADGGAVGRETHGKVACS
jgi:hypothetical protein